MGQWGHGMSRPPRVTYGNEPPSLLPSPPQMSGEASQARRRSDQQAPVGYPDLINFDLLLSAQLKCRGPRSRMANEYAYLLS